MNIGSLNSAMRGYNINGNVKRNAASFDLGGGLSSSAVLKTGMGDNLLDKYWNITDSMPRESQISFAASIVANRVMPQGITGENESFIKNIANKFSTDEMNVLKSEVKASSLIKNKSEQEINSFFKNFDEFINIQKANELESAEKQRANPKLNNQSDVFFRAAMLMNGI